MFTGVFSVLTPEQIVALTSCFVWTEKSEVGVKVQRLLTPALYPFALGIADKFWRKCHRLTSYSGRWYALQYGTRQDGSVP